ncbi:hypothetical protein GWK47_012778 [Chionoecetes opilio]|uniref:Uncharacterized protein n=1 Tax=Chionoecetes opilio TaxID=41210 RepID=A0A8J4XX07_CHIOP|nr:hypothetical protein GWK47_012778 [Chionoecetes opilio]
MAYSSPGALADVEAALALTDVDAMSEKNWPPPALHTHQGSTSATAAATPGLPHPYPVTPTSTSTKRPIDHASDTSGELRLPLQRPPGTTRLLSTPRFLPTPALASILRGHLPSLHMSLQPLPQGLNISSSSSERTRLLI